MWTQSEHRVLILLEIVYSRSLHNHHSIDGTSKTKAVFGLICDSSPSVFLRTHGKISARIKIQITFIFRLRRRPIQLVRLKITNWMGQRGSLKIKIISNLILTEIFPSALETWYLKTLDFFRYFIIAFLFKKFWILHYCKLRNHHNK